MGSETTTTTTAPNPFAIATWLAHPWAIMPDELYTLAAFAGIDPKDFAEKPAGLLSQTDDDEFPSRNPTIRVVPVYGVLLPRANLCMEMFGMGMSLPSVVSAVRAATEDPRVEQIILDIDSPGGPVAGVMEAGRELSGIRAATDIPITAISRYVCASSAYWIACAAADKIVASPSSLTGSIGVYAVHIDRSGAYEREGLNISVISAGKYKTEGSDAIPLDAEATAYMQRKADYYYTAFLETVAQARGASPADVAESYGEGRVLTAGDALEANIVDQIQSIDEFLNQSRDSGRMRASAPVDVAATLDEAWQHRNTQIEGGENV